MDDSYGVERTKLLAAATKKTRDIARVWYGGIDLAVELLELIQEPVPFCQAQTLTGRRCRNVTDMRRCRTHIRLRRDRREVVRRAVGILRRVLPLEPVWLITQQLADYLAVQDRRKTTKKS